MTNNKMHVETKDTEMIFTRVFDAPRDLVFETYTDCKHLKNWWGPREWPLSYCKMDFREGGTWLYCMSGPDGEEAWGKAIYKKIIKPEKIVWNDHFSDKDGNVNEELPQGLMSAEFADYKGKTKVTGRAKYPTSDDLKAVLDMGMVDGMAETLDRLEEHLAEVLATK